MVQSDCKRKRKTSYRRRFAIRVLPRRRVALPIDVAGTCLAVARFFAERVDRSRPVNARKIRFRDCDDRTRPHQPARVPDERATIARSRLRPSRAESPRDARTGKVIESSERPTIASSARRPRRAPAAHRAPASRRQSRAHDACDVRDERRALGARERRAARARGCVHPP